MDSFGPIADNANGIGEISEMDARARQVVGDAENRQQETAVRGPAPSA